MILHLVEHFKVTISKLLGAYSWKVANNCCTCNDCKAHLRHLELFTKQIAGATIAKVVANDSKICDVPLVVAKTCFTSQIRVYKLFSSSLSRLKVYFCRYIIAICSLLAANFATRFVNKSYRTGDVDRKRFATLHVRSTFVNRPPGVHLAHSVREFTIH